MPAISGFEDKILKHRDDIAKMQQIIRNFDGLICDKSSKEHLAELRRYCEETYILKADNAAFLEESKATLAEYSAKIKYLDELVR